MTMDRCANKKCMAILNSLQSAYAFESELYCSEECIDQAIEESHITNFDVADEVLTNDIGLKHVCYKCKSVLTNEHFLIDGKYFCSRACGYNTLYWDLVRNKTLQWGHAVPANVAITLGNDADRYWDDHAQKITKGA